MDVTEFPYYCHPRCDGGKSLDLLLNGTKCPKVFDTRSPPFQKMITKIDLGCKPDKYVLCSYCPNTVPDPSKSG